MGRPTGYTADIAQGICARLADGETLREICRSEEMPARSTVHLWLLAHSEFSDQYARAREIQADAWADELVEIADNGSNDWMERNRQDDQGYQVNGEHIQRSRLRADTRKWLMSKVAAKKYGDKVQQEISGPDGGPVTVAALSDIDRAKALAALVAKAQIAHKPDGH